MLTKGQAAIQMYYHSIMTNIYKAGPILTLTLKISTTWLKQLH